MGHGWKGSLLSFLLAWLCAASAGLAACAWERQLQVTELPCLQPPAPCPMASQPWEAAAAPALGPWQRGGGVGQSLSHAAFRFGPKHGRGSVVLSVLWGVVTQLHSHFKGSFSRGGSLFPWWVMLWGLYSCNRSSLPPFFFHTWKMAHPSSLFLLSKEFLINSLGIWQKSKHSSLGEKRPFDLIEWQEREHWLSLGTSPAPPSHQQHLSQDCCTPACPSATWKLCLYLHH